MYLNAILLFLTWPLLIVIAWFLVRFIVKKYRNSFERVEE